MKCKIDEHGFFWIKRAGKWKRATGPHNSTSCGDHCALFGETEFIEEDNVMVSIELELCNGSLFMDSFTDEREVQQ